MSPRLPFLVNFGYNPWSPYWKRNQTVAALLVRRGLFAGALFANRELWLGDLFRHPSWAVRSPHRYYQRGILPFVPEHGITVFTPVLFARGGRLRVLNGMLVRGRLNDVRREGAPTVVIVNYLSAFLDSVMARLGVRPCGRVFDYSDDFAQFSTDPVEQAGVSALCQKEIARSDVVLSANATLHETAQRLNATSALIRNATNFFSLGGDPHTRRIPRPLARLAPPVIGYMGWLNELRLDLDLIEFIVSARPSWTFVFIGPKSGSSPLGRRIPRLSNVRVVGPVPYAHLPAVLQRFDVAILPNRVNDHTRGNDPIKIYDYLASGRPVVATPTAGTEQFPDHLRIADSPRGFLAQIEEALRESDPKLTASRIALARAHSWETRVSLVEDALRRNIPSAWTC